MDDLLRELLTETSEHLDTVDLELVRFEQDPNNAKILGNIFRLVHTIKGTCGFLGLPRLEALAHAAETLMGKFRDGMAVTSDAPANPSAAPSGSTHITKAAPSRSRSRTTARASITRPSAGRRSSAAWPAKPRSSA